MMKIFLFLSAALVTAVGYSQSIDRQNIETAGAYFENENLSINWSIGEVVASTVGNSSIILTQGFQQSNITVTSLPDVDKIDIISVYPNPVIDELTIENQGNKCHYKLIDLQGKIILHGALKNEVNVIDFTSIKEGTYLLKIENTLTHKIIKK